MQHASILCPDTMREQGTCPYNRCINMSCCVLGCRVAGQDQLAAWLSQLNTRKGCAREENMIIPDIISNSRKLQTALTGMERVLSEHDDATPYADVAGHMSKLGFGCGWGKSVARIREMAGMLQVSCGMLQVGYGILQVSCGFGFMLLRYKFVAWFYALLCEIAVWFYASLCKSAAHAPHSASPGYW